MAHHSGNADHESEPKRGKPWWLAAIMPTAVIGSVGLLVILTFRTALWIHTIEHPGIGLAQLSGLSGALICLGSFVASLVPGTILANLLLWVVPPIRAAVEKYDTERPFNESMFSLFRGMPFLVVPGVLIALFGALEPWAV